MRQSKNSVLESVLSTLVIKKPCDLSIPGAAQSDSAGKGGFVLVYGVFRDFHGRHKTFCWPARVDTPTELRWI